MKTLLSVLSLILFVNSNALADVNCANRSKASRFENTHPTIAKAPSQVTTSSQNQGRK